MTYLIGEDSAPRAHVVHEALTEEAPQIATVRIPGVCHLMPVQQSEAVADAVRLSVPAE